MPRDRIPPHFELFTPQMVLWADAQPQFARLLVDGEQRLREALNVLDATAVAVVTGGWGGICVKAETADGRMLAVKVPAELPDRTAVMEYKGLQVLHAAGVAPQPVGCGDGWLALEWVDAKPLAGKRQRLDHIDTGRFTHLMRQVGSVSADGFVRKDDILVKRVTVSPSSWGPLLELGVNPDKLNRVNTEAAVALTPQGPQGFCHGDFDPANILDTAVRYTLIDPQPRVGPLEAELGWLIGSAACGSTTGDVELLRRELCDVVGADVERVKHWERLYAASWLCELHENNPEHKNEIECLSRVVMAEVRS